MKQNSYKLARFVMSMLLIFFTVPAGFFLSINTAFALSYTVTTNSNAPGNGDCTDGDVTLLEAVTCANSHPGADTITIPADGSMGGGIVLGGGLVINAGEDLSIVGAGSGSTSITLGGISIAGAAFNLQGVTLTPAGSPQSMIQESAAFTGNFLLNDVTIENGATLGIFLGASDGFTITGNVSVTNSTIASAHGGIIVGLGGGSPTTKLHITGTVDISDNDITITPPDGNGFNTAVAFFSGDADGAVSINNNTFIQGGTAEASGFVAIDMQDLGTAFGSTVSVAGNAMTTGGTDLLGVGIGDLIHSVGLTTISGNTVSGGIGQDANFAGGILMTDGGCIFGGTCTGQDEILISNNDIDVSFEGAPSFPVVLVGGETSTVSGNNVDLNGESANGLVCTSLTGNVNCEVYNNVVSHVGGQSGIVLTPGIDSQTASGDIYNNVVWGGSDDAGMSILAAATPLGGPQPAGTTINANIFNNSIDGGGHSVGIAAGDMTGDTTANVVVFNNAVANYNTTSAAGVMQIGTSEGVFFSHDHNMVGPTSTNAFVSTPDGMSFSDLTLGAGDVVDDPEFTNAATGDLTIGATSPAVNAGVASSNSVNAPSLDILGHTRHGSAPDIGAYDYNAAPTANAGSDQSVHTGDTVNISCTSTDPEDDAVTYQWNTVSGPDTPVYPSGADQSFAASAAGTYVMQCTATDVNGASDTDTVSIVVTDANTAPTANAGTDQYTSIDESNALDCSGSTDPEDDTLAYHWTQTAGTSVSLSNANVAGPTFTPTSFGDRTFQCQVTDPGTLSDTDTVVVHATAKRIAGASDRYDTAVKISQTQYPTSHTVNRLVIASGENYPDALASGPLASLINGPILLTQTNTLTWQTNTEITRLLPTSDGNGSTTDIYVIGGPAAVSESVFNSIKGLHPGFEVKRVAGASDRIDTAIEIAKEMATIRGNAATTVALASGYNYNDAAAISAPASDSSINSRRIPIFLTNTSNLDSRVSTYLNSVKGSVTKAWIVGTTGAVSNSAQTSMNSIFGSSKVSRLNGANAYETSAVIATQFYTAPTQLSVVTGQNFPDVLAAGPYAGSKHMAVLYVTNTTVDSTVTAYADAKASTLTSMYVFGGTTVIPNSIKQTVQQHL